MTGAANTG